MPGFQNVLYIKKPEKQLGKVAKRVGIKTKTAATRQYVPTIQDRLRTKIKLTPEITAVLNGYGMTKAYLYRFHLSEDAKCRCGNEYQSMDHIQFQCEELNAQ